MKVRVAAFFRDKGYFVRRNIKRIKSENTDTCREINVIAVRVKGCFLFGYKLEVLLIEVKKWYSQKINSIVIRDFYEKLRSLRRGPVC